MYQILIWIKVYSDFKLNTIAFLTALKEANLDQITKSIVHNDSDINQQQIDELETTRLIQSKYIMDSPQKNELKNIGLRGNEQKDNNIHKHFNVVIPSSILNGTTHDKLSSNDEV